MRELSGRIRRPPQDLGDLVEWHGERVVQHERETLGGRQCVQHDEQRLADGVGEHHVARGIVDAGDVRRALP